ncbi:MAG TPA: hypothetical protein VKA91_00075 [Nitrososphaeraceae archaeon]|nr:hypothetical protein [Nitrososphaeraceae archaeon]
MGRNILGEQSIEENNIKFYKAFETLSATNSPLMMSILPTLTSALLGLIGLGVHGLLKK